MEALAEAVEGLGVLETQFPYMVEMARSGRSNVRHYGHLTSYLEGIGFGQAEADLSMNLFGVKHGNPMDDDHSNFVMERIFDIFAKDVTVGQFFAESVINMFEGNSESILVQTVEQMLQISKQQGHDGGSSPAF